MGRWWGRAADAPSVLLSASSRTLYSCTFSRWCWNSRHSLSSSSRENLPEVFAWGGLREHRPGAPPAPPEAAGAGGRPYLVPQLLQPGVLQAVRLGALGDGVAAELPGVLPAVQPVLGQDD